MPVVFENPTFPWQVTPDPTNQAWSTQLTYRQMLNEVTGWNPNVDPERAGRLINNYYRKLIDQRQWYGLKVKGALVSKAPVVSGVITANIGEYDVYGTNTDWTPEVVGMQFRTTFTSSYQTIATFIDPGHIRLDTPYLGPTYVDTPYQMYQIYFDFGANVKKLNWCSNQQQGWPLEVNVPVQTINNWDVWRQSLGWSTILATRAPSPSGSSIFECWPSPYQLQNLPFEAYVYPPLLSDDDDCIVPFLPADAIVGRAVADAVMMDGRNNPYYNPEVATMKIGEYKERVAEAVLADNDLDQQDVMWDYGQEDGRVGFGPGSTWSQSHD